MKTLGLVDIIGPIMVGPSSSHTAGALRIARMARGLLGETPLRATLTLYGSFAHTKSGHGTDKALVAGLLGMDADDLEIRDSFKQAHAAQMDVVFKLDPNKEVEHPNTVDIALEGSCGKLIDVRGISVGGGAAVIKRIDGVEVDITGEHTSIVVKQRDACGVLAHITTCLSEDSVNIGTARLFRTQRGAVAYTVLEVDEFVPPRIKTAIERSPSIHEVRIVPADKKTEHGGSDTAPLFAHDIAVMEEAWCLCDFTSGIELLELCNRNDKTIADVFLAREEALAQRGGRPCRALTYIKHAIEVMRTSAKEPLLHPTCSMGGLIGGEARDVQNARIHGKCVVDKLTGKAMEYALAVLETNASMGRIVAAPTAGSAGVIPGVLLALEEERGFKPETLIQGTLTAAAVGYLIARNATVSGAEGGCQAEIGSAAAMAAAAAVEMSGGTPEQALNAAGNALTSLMGLVCDPVGGLVELPCQKRNATAAATALVCAQIALAGIGNLVDFDETVAAMDDVGRALPFELRESALGGLAAAPSACAWCARRTQ